MSPQERSVFSLKLLSECDNNADIYHAKCSDDVPLFLNVPEIVSALEIILISPLHTLILFVFLTKIQTSFLNLLCSKCPIEIRCASSHTHARAARDCYLSLLLLNSWKSGGWIKKKAQFWLNMARPGRWGCSGVFEQSLLYGGKGGRGWQGHDCSRKVPAKILASLLHRISVYQPCFYFDISRMNKRWQYMDTHTLVRKV